MANTATVQATVATGETTAETLLSDVETQLSAGAGLKRAEVDGQVVEWDNTGGMGDRASLKAEIAREAGNRPAVAQINLTKAWG